MKIIINILIILLPWHIRRSILIHYFGYKIDPTARIGLAYVYPKYMELEEGAKIGHFTVAIHLNNILLGAKSSIGRSNWITGFPTGISSKHFQHQLSRKSELIIGKESAITKNHHIDCTNQIIIGDYVTIAGYNSQLLTHSINIYEGRQVSHPICIGDYCFIGTNVVMLGGSVLPPHSVLGAKSLLNKKLSDEWTVYGGVPAKAISTIPKDAKYFSRINGFVY